MKIDIQSTAPQPMTADQINNLAQFILSRKGNVDFGTTSVTVTPATGFSPGMAGIIVKASSGKVSISGATEITDEEWNEIKAYGVPLWMVKAHEDYGISFGNLITAYEYDSEIAKSFNGVGRWLKVSGGSITTNVLASIYDVQQIGVKFSQTASDSNTPWRVSGTNTRLFPYSNTYLYDISNGSGYTRLQGGSITSNTYYEVETCNTISTRYIKDIINNKTLASTTAYSNEFDNKYYSLGCENSAQWNIFKFFRVYSSNGSLKAYFIPMHKDGVNGMYDLIGQQFYGNSGSGTFTIE